MGIRKLQQQGRQGQRERQKNNREKDWQSNNPARLSCFFVHLSCHHFLTTTGMWKYLILHFVEDMNTRQQLSFSFRFEAAQIHF